MKRKVSISRCMVRGKSMWRVRWHEAGRVHRRFFTGRPAADAHAASLQGELVGSTKRLLSLSQQEREILLAVHDAAAERGLGLASLLALLGDIKPSVSPGISKVLDDLLEVKRKSGCSALYVDNIELLASRLFVGRETLAIDRFTAADVERCLDAYRICSRSTLRARISTLFKFAVRRGYRTDNPCDRLERIKHIKPPPQILTLDEARKCLAWFAMNPRALAWFALTTFAGLRPEEADKTRWSAINFDEGLIRVEAQTSKVRQRRVVYPLPAAMTLLKQAELLESELPIQKKARLAELQKLRPVLGWPEWKQDVTRHTAASYWLALTGNAAQVATALGHGEGVMHRNYKALVTKAEAEKFWALTARPA